LPITWRSGSSWVAWWQGDEAAPHDGESDALILDIEFRKAKQEDSASLYASWLLAFGLTDWMVPAYEQDDGRFGRTFVAVQDGQVRSAVYYLIRQLRNAAGDAEPVGCLANVASRPEARGQGWIRRLLQDAVDDMRIHQIRWSLLSTRTPGIYLRSGWRRYELTYPIGPIAEYPRQAPEIEIRRADLTEWRALADLYAGFNARRPLSTVRTQQDWQARVPIWYGPPKQIVLASTGESPSGYLVVDWQHPSVEVHEIAVSNAATADALLSELAGAARRRSVRTGELRIPDDPLTRNAVRRFFAQGTGTGTGTYGYGMIRPLADDGVYEIPTAPGAFHWPGDYF
jgi:N-acetylglutamate synthase-like GNAT family acetyltransferase